ncbi:preprotein translocase subunit SecA [Paramaledivibacter caminithermalis]|uniref:Protein translocase subunit SecA n=1 Tax=Paramaledivibacter caminithermalis (strain DSM 15212 / CIP 107654 / DViRD3) TaxID=1121301 RepID=A0A1M6KEH5_PARC5|nr:preprotein translocase subunit SecA [Paramaledivibacter caminithermalis]SHJ57375.1 protein translocase subunit secA [Paramaledivibacter caminithermalis DSM 15212]
MKNFLKSLVNSHDKKIGQLEKRAEKILRREAEIEKLSDEELRNKTEEFKNRLENGETLDDILEEAFAVVREASYRVLGMKHFPVQLIGGMVLHNGDIAEMKTGEGKTLVATLPAYLNALTGEGVFVVTVNDYLAARDRAEMGQIYEFLGLNVGLISREMRLDEKKAAYMCDITYGTNSEFGFDYLRDNMAVLKENVVQRSLNYAIIDEVDSILIDESRTPLIISGQSNRPSQYYITVDKFVKSLKKDDYETNDDNRIITLSDSGMDKAERVFGLENIADVKNMELLHHIRQSLYANYIMKKDQDYVVKDGEIQIVDKFTGRLMPGRRFSRGLHQAIEAKEGVEIQKESKTMATITYQNYFRKFKKLSGMTGTAYTERSEFRSIYNMDVFVIPTNKPLIRIDHEDKLFKTEEAKFKAVVDEIEKRHKKGQPVLVGTIYIDKSEILSDMLDKRGISHKLLNAKQDKDEAEIVSKAGQKNAVTIATNMAGRGTDIKLGEGVAELGGLLVLGTERHDSRRIDNQLRGRSGRQGDPGESIYFISLEDSLFQKLGLERMAKIKDMVDKLGVPDYEAIEDKMLSKAVENTQRTIENYNFKIRKSTLEFDEILNNQRETIYNERNKILNGEDMSDFIKEVIKGLIEKAVDVFTGEQQYPEQWDLVGLQDYLDNKLGFNGRFNLKDLELDEIVKLEKAQLKKDIYEEGLRIYGEKEKEIGEKSFRYLERLIFMKNIDRKWVEHLDVVEQIRQGIGFQGIGREDPVRVFNREAFNLFNDMLEDIKEETTRYIFGLKKSSKSHKKEETKITEKEREERVLELEDKYKVSRKHLPQIPANLPQIRFNADINATENIDVDIALYYLSNGLEERLSEYDKTIQVKGVFPVEFQKPKDKDWEKGWYQAKIFVAGEEASIINFMVTDAVDLEEMKRKREIQRKTDLSVKFFSNKSPNISFKLDINDYKGDKIQAALIYNGDQKNASRFDVPVNDAKAGINLHRPKNGWRNGFYQLVLGVEGKGQIAIPFMIVDEYKREEEEINIKLNVNIPEGKAIDIIGQMVYIETKQQVVAVPIKLNKAGEFNIQIKKQDKNWNIGRYEFRLIASNKIILTKHFLIK